MIDNNGRKVHSLLSNVKASWRDVARPHATFSRTLARPMGARLAAAIGD